MFPNTVTTGRLICSHLFIKRYIEVLLKSLQEYPESTFSYYIYFFSLSLLWHIPSHFCLKITATHVTMSSIKIYLKWHNKIICL